MRGTATMSKEWLAASRSGDGLSVGTSTPSSGLRHALWNVQTLDFGQELARGAPTIGVLR